MEEKGGEKKEMREKGGGMLARCGGENISWGEEKKWMDKGEVEKKWRMSEGEKGLID